MSDQDWSCSACTFKQSVHSMRCAMCGTPNPFQPGSQSGYNNNYDGFAFQQAPPKPKPVVKKELAYQAKPRPNKEFGKIIYQTDRITKSQVLDTFAIYELNKDITSSSWPLYVFGENDIDKVRGKGVEREMIGGLAGVLGDYDSTVSFGITTTFYRDKSVNNDFNAFTKIIDNDFEALLKYIKNGHDIIVPSPNMQDLYGMYEKSYWKTIDNEKKQIIFHNIGTGLACIPFHYIEYIQKKFDKLREIGDKNTENGVNMKIDRSQSNEDQKETDAQEKNVSEPPQQTNPSQDDQPEKTEKDTVAHHVLYDDDAELARALAASMQND